MPCCRQDGDKSFQSGEEPVIRYPKVWNKWITKSGPLVLYQVSPSFFPQFKLFHNGKWLHELRPANWQNKKTSACQKKRPTIMFTPWMLHQLRLNDNRESVCSSLYRQVEIQMRTEEIENFYLRGETTLLKRVRQMVAPTHVEGGVPNHSFTTNFFEWVSRFRVSQKVPGLSLR